MSDLLGNGKARNVTVIVWLEELEKLGKDYWDLVSFLQGLHIECVISPLHDKDTYTAEDVRKWVKRKESEVGIEKLYDAETGELLPNWSDVAPKVGDLKKAHVHVFFKFAGVRTAEFLSDMMSDFGLEIGLWRWLKVNSPTSIIRYFAHMDDPDKYQYSPMDIIPFGGIDVSCVLKQDSSSRLRTLLEVQRHIDEHEIKSYHVLSKWAFSTGTPDIVACVTGRSSHFIGYFRSIRDEEMAKKAEEKEAQAQNCI